MASFGERLAPGTHVRFGSLDFVATEEGKLTRAPVPAQLPHSTSLDTIIDTLGELRVNTLEARVPGGDKPPSFDWVRFERQLNAFLGPRPSQEDMSCLTFSLTNVTAQLAGGEPHSPHVSAPDAPTTFPFGLRNAAGTYSRLAARRAHPSSADIEFVGVTEYVSESFFDLLARD